MKCRCTIAAALLALAACGGGGGGEDAPPPPAGLQPTLASIQANVFTPICADSGCHATPGMNGLNLDNVGISSSNLITVPAFYGNGLVRVVPGDSGNSFLIQKLEGTTMFGGRMPLMRTPLQQVTIDVIRQWIDSCVGNTCP
jgi:hypothetical protein